MVRVHPQMALMKKRAADFAARNSFLPLSEVMRKFHQQVGVEFAQAWMSQAIKQHHGISYTQLQKRERLAFIVANAKRSNKWIAQKLGMSEKTLSRLTGELKAEGKIRASKRYAETKRSLKEKIPLAYHGSAQTIMRFLFWSPTNFGLSISEIAKTLGMQQSTIDMSIRLMKKHGLVLPVKKVEQFYYYTPSKKGVVWFRKIQSLRKERDAVLEKTASISSVIKRKKNERRRLTDAVVFIQENGLKLDTLKIYGATRRVDAEINRLERIQRERKIRNSH